MIPLSSAVPGKFTWSKISYKPNYELKLDDQVVGTLNRPSVWSSALLAETHNGRWTFRRSGFWGSEIVDAISGQQIAICKWSWGGKGTLAFTDGQTFKIWSTGFWRPVWMVTTENDQPVLQFHTRGSNGEKTVGLPEAAVVPEDRLTLLIMFAWYCMVKTQEDAATAAMVAGI
jgi:hypothetical protein